MSELAHLEALSSKQETIDKEIKQSFTNYSSDHDLKLMKQKRLRIREEIEQLSRRLKGENEPSFH
jgi:hypothetical protein